MDKKVNGLMMVSAPMSNFNADFSGNPKTTPSGVIFASDNAYKYCVKEYLERINPKSVFYKKSYKLVEGDGISNLEVRTPEERYAWMFGELPIISGSIKKKGKKKKSEKNTEENTEEKEEKIISDGVKVAKNLLSCVDIKNFGMTASMKGMDTSITGVTQIGKGVDVTPDNFAAKDTILSPFKFDDNKKNSTIGSYSYTEEAHYLYPISIVPDAIKMFVDNKATEEYSEDDYTAIKEAMLRGVTEYKTRTKMHCFNEFAIFMEMKKDAFMPDLVSSLHFEKDGDGEKNKITFNIKDWAYGIRNQILKLEVYYEPTLISFSTDIAADIVYEEYDIRNLMKID